MAKNKALKVWLEGISDLTSVESYGMSSALGATTADLPNPNLPKYKYLDFRSE